MEQFISYMIDVAKYIVLFIAMFKGIELLDKWYHSCSNTQALEQQVDNLIEQQEYFIAMMKVINEASYVSTAEFTRLLDKINQAATFTTLSSAQEESPISLARSALSKSNTIELYIDDSKALIIQLDPIKPAYRTYDVVTSEIRMHTHYSNRITMYDDIIGILCAQYRENDNVSIVAISSMLEYTDLTEVIAKMVDPIQKRKDKSSLIIR